MLDHLRYRVGEAVLLQLVQLVGGVLLGVLECVLDHLRGVLFAEALLDALILQVVRRVAAAEQFDQRCSWSDSE